MDLVSAKFGIFGLPFRRNTARLMLLPVPWDVTTSYGKGTSAGPEAIRNASEQVDLYDFETGSVYEQGIYMLPLDRKIQVLNKALRAKAEKVMLAVAEGKESPRIKSLRQDVNTGSDELNAWVYRQSKGILENNQILGLVGGDHSSPFGCIQAVLEKNPHAGVLHIDAHADLRDAYQGFEHSHASIMHNVVTQLHPSKLVQVGIRDFSSEEQQFAEKNNVQVFYDFANKQKQLSGTPWSTIVEQILSHLPQDVYISFDIDGLSPDLCPSTGTPVPGGLSWSEAQFLLSQVVQSGRRIVGFDLNEVAPGKTEWDANVGARMLYRLCCLTLKSNKI